MSKKLLIRPATPADVPAVLPMVAKICALHETWDEAKYGFLPHPEQRYEGWLKKLATRDTPDGTLRDRSVFLVATAPAQPEKLVGFIVSTVEKEIQIYRLKEFGFIHDLWVEPEYRGSSIARQMVMQTIEEFKLKGVKQIRLDTAAVNESARRLFLSCGFRVSTIEMLVELEET